MITHLDLRHDDASVLTGRGEGSERSGQNYGTRACETAEVTAGDVVHFVPHDHCVHDKEARPRQPQRVLLHDERRTLEAQCYGHASAGEQVKTATESEDYCALVQLSLWHSTESLDHLHHTRWTKRQCSLTLSHQSFLVLLRVGICNAFSSCGFWHASFHDTICSVRAPFSTLRQRNRCSVIRNIA